MGEYRVAADKEVRRRVVVPRSMSLPIAIQQQESSLFDKYMPNNRHQLRRSYPSNLSSSNGSSLSFSSSSIQDKGEEFNKRYYFWKDESGSGSNSNSGISLLSSTENVQAKENIEPPATHNPTTQRYVTFTVIETLKDEEKKGDPFTLPNEENTVVLSCLNHCLLTGKQFKGTYYAFLMSHTVSGKKKDTNIGVSRYPIFSVIAHNNQARINDETASVGNVLYFPVIYDKDTASAAPYWRLNTTLGPFYSKHTAEECCHEWVKKTRGTTSKQEKARVLAEMFHCSLFSSQTPINMSIERYLYENNAPLQYIKECQAIKKECRGIIAV